MGAASISSLFVSIVTYFQNLGITVELPNITLPEPVVNALRAIKEFFNFVISLLPFLPNFDTRCMMVLLALGVPFVLDLLFVWLVRSLFKSVLHLIDIAALVVIGYYCYVVALVKSSTESISFMVISALWLIVHGGYNFFTRRKTDITLREVAHDICEFFMDGVMPHVQTHLSLSELNEKLRKFSGTIQITAKVSRWYTSLLFFISGVAIIVGSVILSGDIKIPGWTPPAAVRVFVPIIGYIIGGCLIILSIMKQTMCGANCVLSVRKFVKRWGLRLLMLCIELLYIPINSALMNQIMPTKITLSETEFIKINYTSSAVDMFETHKYEIVNCTLPIEGICKDVCGKTYATVLANDKSLYFFDDIILVNGATIAYTFIFVLIGIPLLWLITIKKNRKFMFEINVYGDGAKAKWRNTINRMHTTGIFFFSEYKVTRSTWNVYIMFTKFLCMAISAISAAVWKEAFFFLPIPYVLIVIFIIWKKPYIHKVNNVLDFILYLANVMFNLIPILSYFGVEIPSTVSIVLTCIMFAIPVISIIVLLCRYRGDGQIDPNDPTALTKKMREDIEQAREDYRNGYDQHDTDSYDSEYETDEDDFIQTQLGQTMAGKHDLELPIFTDKQYNVEVKVSSLETINESLTREGRKLIDYEDGNARKINNSSKKKDRTIVVNRYYLAIMFEKMFQMLDVVIDGETISSVLNVLNVAVFAAAFCFGWYISALTNVYASRVAAANCG